LDKRSPKTDRQGRKISRAEIREYKTISKKWEKFHEKEWGRYGDKPYIMPHAERSVMSTGWHNRHERNKQLKRKLPVYEQNDRAYMRKVVENMKIEMSPATANKKAKKLKSGMLDVLHMSTIASDELRDLIDGLSVAEIKRLNKTSSFVDIYYATIDSPNRSSFIELSEGEHVKQNLMDTVSLMREDMGDESKWRNRAKAPIGRLLRGLGNMLVELGRR
jgi:hypothetical protein